MDSYKGIAEWFIQMEICNYIIFYKKRFECFFHEGKTNGFGMY